MPTLQDIGVSEGGQLLGRQFNTLGNLGLGAPSTGRMTWFNPRPYTYTDPVTGRAWTDTGAQRLREGAHASGLPISTPGIATAGRGGLGHWYEVTLPDGRRYVTQKTDIGPSGVVDLNAALASRAYPGGPETMTGRNVTTRYIGAELPPGVTPGEMGGWQTTVGASPEGVGYSNPARSAQGATTDPRELVRPSEGFSLARGLAGFDFTPAAAPPIAPTGLGALPGLRFAPLGQRRGG